MYQTPPVNCHVLCVDELGPLSAKTYLTARWSPQGYRPRVTPDYGRRGIAWVMGALEPATGDVFTCTTLSRRTADNVAFTRPQWASFRDRPGHWRSR